MLQEAASTRGIAITVNSVGSMLTPFFSADPVADYAGARAADAAVYARLFNRLLAAGVYSPPSQFETWFVSAPLAAGSLDRLAELVRRAFTEL